MITRPPRSTIFILSICLFFFRVPAGAGEAKPEVGANGELLVGEWQGGATPVAVFRGIPFAAPPVGPLRWAAPRAHTARSGRQDAGRFAAACMQGTGGVDWYIGVAAAFGAGPDQVARPHALSEDCLYLNVWTPAPRRSEGAGLPVMVYVHGGGNSGGWSYEPNYLGGQLAARGVIVVTIAYRLGPFGFFSHPALDNDRGEPVANFALLDIRAAFEWVRDHIAGFGGDPGNITAFGESAGAINLVDLLLADLSRGRGSDSLFRKLISQSIGGSLAHRQSLAEEQATGVEMLGTLGFDAAAPAAAIRAIPAADLLHAAEQLPPDHYPDGVIDGQVLPVSPLVAIGRADARGVALIAGSNADEWLMYLEPDTSREDVENWIAQREPEQAEALRAQAGAFEDPRRALDWLTAGDDMLCPGQMLVQQVNARGGDGWVYRFTRQREGQGGDRLGAYHGAELPYVFDRHDDWLDTTPADIELGEAIMDYWVAFARNGKPAAAGRPVWPRHDKADQLVLELGDEIRAMESPARRLCSLLGPRIEGEREIR